MGTVVKLNIYDLSPANDCLYAAGIGLHHSGVEIMGTEYTFASGSGIFEMQPKDGQGAKFRESLELGSFEGGSSEVRNAINDLRSNFGPSAYNLINNNCNHFANALIYTLLRKQIPSYINRLANIGTYVSCLLPKQMLESAPVGDSSNGGSSSSGYQVHAPGSTAMSRNTGSASSFAGPGMTVGTSSSFNSNSNSSATNGIRSVFGSAVSRVGSSNSNERKDDLIDRRERARKAAMTRLSEDDKSR